MHFRLELALDNIDLAFAKERGIAVYNTPDVVTNSTADLAFAIFLSYIRKFPEAQAFVKQDKWKGWEPDLYLGEELTGKIFGIIGFGRIGRAITERALGFGLKVVVYHRSPIKGSYERITQISWEEFLNTVDYFSINVPMNDETHHLIDYQVMKQMKKRPLLMNMARGPIVNTDDLVRALKEDLLRGAVLDVTDPEPIGGDHPLCSLENCLVVPHIGTATVECRNTMAKIAAENLVKHFQ